MIRALPGLALATGIGVAAMLAARFTPAAVSAVLLALIVGLVFANVLAVPPVLAPGIDVAAKRVLRVGVALLGARLTLTDVAAIGGPSLGIVLATMTAAFVTVAVAGRLAGIAPELGILIGTGTAVCGNSAIVAASPIIDAEERQVSYAVATITIFGTIALVAFPLIGRALAMPDEAFGVWAGLAINDTSQVVAAGAAYSDRALEHATVVKLVRNALMAPILIALTVWARRRAGDHGDERSSADSRWLPSIRTAVPGFVFGFIALAGLRSLGLIDDRAADGLGAAATVAITIAIAGVGLKTRLTDLASVGARPVLVGFAAALTLAGVSLPLAYLVAG